MTDAELLEQVKTGLNITGNYQDSTLRLYIDDTKNYMNDAGVPLELINSDVSVGVIVRGVSDLWNYGLGTATFSEYFSQRVIQLRYKVVPATLGELKVVSSSGGEIGTTKITVTGQSENPIYKYFMNPRQITLPEYGENLSEWAGWDGNSDIVAEDGHYICIAEVSDKFEAMNAGTSRIIVNLG